MIKDIRLYTVLNSMLKPTVMVKVWTDDGREYSASVPAGTSKGATEAKELPLDKVRKAFSTIRGNLIMLDEDDWVNADVLLKEIDGTEDFSRIGGNLSLAISLAFARAATGGQLWKLTGRNLKAEFPIPACNIIGGGSHGGGTAWQEFLVMPHRTASPMEAAQTAIDIWSTVGEELKRKGVLLGKNREGAWMSKLDEFETLNLLSELSADFKFRIGVDFAATSFWKKDGYTYAGKPYSPGQHLDAILQLAMQHKIYYLEDPFHENDFLNFSRLTKELGNRALIVGDDLYTTNLERLRTGLKEKSTNAIIIKPNQIGTVHQTVQVANLARENSHALVPSHRSQETGDDWLPDLALALGAPLIKIGMVDIPKFNRLSVLWNEVPDTRMSKLPLSSL
jgi:enolase